jgi:hypothetical protein
MINMIMAATPNRTTAITSGCAIVRPILVAVAAEAQEAAKRSPAIVHFNFAFPGLNMVRSCYPSIRV